MKVTMLEEVGKLVVKDIEMPKRVEADDVLIKVTKVGICGSDIHMWHNEKKLGLVMGHEFCGEVVDPGTSDFKVGERVVVIPKGPRGYESTPGIMAQGGFAEYFMAAAEFLIRLPDSINDDAANMIEPNSIGYVTMLKSNVKYGDKVLITGTGVIGLLCAEWARAMGATYIAMTDVNEKRIAKAKSYGVANNVFDAKDPNVATLLKSGSGGGFDIVIEGTAVPSSVNLALDVIKNGGTYMFIGITYKQVPIDALKLVMKNVTMMGTFGSVDYFDKVIELMGHKPFDVTKYITKHIGLEDIQDMFGQLHAGTSDELKVVVSPSNS